MPYFTEVDDYKTYAGKEDDFHFIYNANTGGGQSFLGGKYRNQSGGLVSPTSLRGCIGVFRFVIGEQSRQRDVLIDNESVSYEIKPRAEGDSNMKLGVGGKPTPSEAIAAFLMLPKPCGVKKACDINTSVLNGNNYWLQSMWLDVDASIRGKAIFTPKDCIICGGIDKQGQGSARYFSIDFAKRFADVIRVANNDELDGEVLTCVKFFADIYKGEKPFVYDEAVAAIKAVMKYLSSKYPEEYSGTLDPLSMICELSKKKDKPTGQFGAPYQLIIYGAPGTGKSWRIKNDTQGVSVIRTTFHPDSDYSTFVGAYKPSMEADEYDTVVTTGERSPGGNISKKDGLVRQKRIVYKFVAQAFLKAYVAAWKKMADAADGGQGAARPTVCLVIEEINRGSCAQIFGDLFQLLDRDDYGFSDYEIAADEDLRRYLAEAFKGVRGADAQERVPPEVAEKLEQILKGEILLLPPNLYIWATMNTSDQSLFPIDSAFKRRWAWKYIPISNAGKNYSIEVGGDKYDWWTFLEKANDLVQSFTESEDKKLGYFFCKADRNGVISLEQFVGKVVFYLWNGVFKDTGFDDEVFDDGKGGKLYFKRFFDAKGDPNPESVRQFMKNLGVGAVASSAGNAEGADEGATTEPPAGDAENMEGQGQ